LGRKGDFGCANGPSGGWLGACRFTVLGSHPARTIARRQMPQAIAGLGEFTKLVYESTFTKCSEGMSFVDAELAFFE